MAKKIQGYVRLQLPAGAANPAPPVGPALGAQGVNIMGFCKEFNAKSLAAGFEKDTPIPVVITVFSEGLPWWWWKRLQDLSAHSVRNSANKPKGNQSSFQIGRAHV